MLYETPPATRDQIAADVATTATSVYLYVGRADDDGWDTAKAVHAVTAGRNFYLIKNRAIIAEWDTGQERVGFVFGRKPTVQKSLTQAEAEDMEVLNSELLKAEAP